MSSEESGKSENFGSAAHLMIEALDKASKELEGTVDACLTQVREHADVQEKALAGRLKKFFEQSGNLLDGHVDDLSNKKEEFIERLMEFERTELETLTATAKEIRQQVNAKAQQATDSINRLVEEQVAELKAYMNEPKPILHEIVDARLEVVKEIGRASKDKVEESEAQLEKVISERAEEFDRGIQAVVEESKHAVEDKLDEHNRQFEAKINSVMTGLSDAVTLAGDDLKDKAHEAPPESRRRLRERPRPPLCSLERIQPGTRRNSKHVCRSVEVRPRKSKKACTRQNSTAKLKKCAKKSNIFPQMHRAKLPPATSYFTAHSSALRRSTLTAWTDSFPVMNQHLRKKAIWLQAQNRKRPAN